MAAFLFHLFHLCPYHYPGTVMAMSLIRRIIGGCHCHSASDFVNQLIGDEACKCFVYQTVKGMTTGTVSSSTSIAEGIVHRGADLFPTASPRSPFNKQAKYTSIPRIAGMSLVRPPSEGYAAVSDSECSLAPMHDPDRGHMLRCRGDCLHTPDR